MLLITVALVILLTVCEAKIRTFFDTSKLFKGKIEKLLLAIRETAGTAAGAFALNNAKTFSRMTIVCGNFCIFAAMEDKIEKYRLLTAQIRALIEGEKDAIAVMANICAAIHETMGFFWTGFYRVQGGELVLGPFQGPVACMHIGFGRGVCGTAWEQRKTIVVPDVEKFPGHIACSSLSRSEIVVPVCSINGDVVAVLDIDSKELATFDDIDRKYLEDIVDLLQ